MQALTFHTTQFDIVDRVGQPWLQARQIGAALGYAREDSINKIYERNADEFTSDMTCNVNLTLQGQQREVRVFSLRGAHLLGMFARTGVAKEFRRWVLDVLEGKVELHSQPRIAPTFDLDYPVDRWLNLGPLNAHYRDTASVYIPADLLFDLPSPTLRVLGELKRAGYDVEACYLKTQALRHHLEVSRDFIQSLSNKCGDVLNQGIRLQRRR